MEVFLSSHNLMANKLYRNKITTQALRFADGHITDATAAAIVFLPAF